MKQFFIALLVLITFNAKAQYFAVTKSPKGLKHIEISRVNLLTIAWLPYNLFKEQCIKEGFKVEEKDGSVIATMGGSDDITKGTIVFTKNTLPQYADISIFCVQTNLNYENVPFQRDITLELVWNGIKYIKGYDGFDVYSMINEDEKLRMILKLKLDDEDKLLTEDIIFDLSTL
jgi:hypothetical protein